MMSIFPTARKCGLVVFVLVMECGAIAAAPGGLDPAFGTGGKYQSDYYGRSMFGPAIGVQPDGRIIAVGKNFSGQDDDFAVVRLTSAGAFESGTTEAFAPGKNEEAKAILILPDGRTVAGGEGNAGGYAQHGVMRFLANGSLDPTFGNGGKVSVDFGRLSHVHSMALQPDGKIVIVGESYGGANESRAAMARLNTDGSLDTTFGQNGLVQASFGEATNGHAVVIGADGQITIGGYLENSTATPASACFVARFSTSGRSDTSFGNGGVTLLDMGSDRSSFCHALAVQPDGKTVIAGSSVRAGVGLAVVARFTAAGQLDTGFDGDGVVGAQFEPSALSDSGASAVVLKADGKLVIGGHSDGKWGLARFTTTGALDASFGNGGRMAFAFGRGVDDQIKSLAVQADGKILAAGYSRDRDRYVLAVARILN